MDIRQAVERLVKGAGVDRGLAAVGVHAFLEAWLWEKTGLDFQSRKPDGQAVTFRDLVNFFLDSWPQKWVKAPATGWGPFVGDLKADHDMTNQVRHKFALPSTLEFQNLVNNFLIFAERTGLLELEIDRKNLRQALLPEDGEWIRTSARELAQLHDRLGQLESELLTRTEELGRLRQLETARASLLGELEDSRAELARLEKAQAQESDQQRRQAFEARQKLQKLEKDKRDLEVQLSSLDRYREVLDLAEKTGALTRSSVRLQEILLQPSQEQEEILNRDLDFSRDLLVKGSAGTGKSLILLMGLEKYFKTADGPIPLLAFNRPLKTLNESLLNQLLQDHRDQVLVQTTTQFLAGEFKKVFPDKTWFFSGAEDPAAQPGKNLWLSLLQDNLPGCFATTAEFAKELETLIWDRGLSLAEYQTVARRGLGKPLNESQRRQVWAALETLEPALEQATAWPMGYAWKRLAEAELPAAYPCLFVDEVQDLGRSVLKVLKKVCRQALVMAGDPQQMVYKGDSPFADQGIFPVPPKVKTLKLGYRNTRPIQEAADRFLGTATGNLSAREGAPPVVLAVKKEDMKPLLLQQIELYVNRYGYSPENILVACNPGEEQQELVGFLKKAGHHATTLKDEDFDFKETPGLRVSSFALCKGLNFPIVMVYLSGPPYQALIKRSGLEDSETVRRDLEARLLYVAVTRAMDRLILVANSESRSSVVQRLLASFRPATSFNPAQP